MIRYSMLFPHAPNRSGYGSFRCPAVIQPFLNKLFVAAKVVAPLSGRHCEAVAFNNNIASLVVRLRGPARPLDIAGFISSVVVNPVNRVIGGWSWADMLNKVSVPVLSTKRFMQSYASAAVMFEIFIVRVIAPLSYRAPDHMLKGVGVSMCFIEHACRFFPKAAAANGFPRVKAFGQNVFACPAVTGAGPHCSSSIIWRSANSKQPSKSMVRDILKNRHWFTSSKSVLRWAGADTPVCRHSNILEA